MTTTDAAGNKIPDFVHCRDCDGCTDWDEGHVCHGCGHSRADIWDYSFGYYCTDCRMAIQQWRRADAQH